MSFSIYQIETFDEIIRQTFGTEPVEDIIETMKEESSEVLNVYVQGNLKFQQVHVQMRICY